MITAGVDREIYREIKDGRGDGIDYGSSLGNVRDVDMQTAEIFDVISMIESYDEKERNSIII